MPRDYAFEHYVRKSSYSYLCREDADPQGDWERQREINSLKLEKSLEEEQAKAEELQREGGTKAKTNIDRPELLSVLQNQALNSYEFDGTHLEGSVDVHKCESEGELIQSPSDVFPCSAIHLSASQSFTDVCTVSSSIQSLRSTKCSAYYLCRQDADPQGEWEMQPEMNSLKLEKSLEEEINDAVQQAKAEELQREGGTKAKANIDRPELLSVLQNQALNSYEFDGTHLEGSVEVHKCESEGELIQSPSDVFPCSAIHLSASQSFTDVCSVSSSVQSLRSTKCSAYYLCRQDADPQGEWEMQPEMNSLKLEKSLEEEINDAVQQAKAEELQREGGTKVKANTGFQRFNSYEFDPTYLEGSSPTDVNFSRATLHPPDSSRPPPEYRGVVMVLDENHKLRQVETDDQLRSYMNGLSEDFSLSELTTVLDYIQKVPVEQIRHHINIAEFIKKLQDGEIMCDIHICVGAERYSAHCAALSCFSSYFSDLCKRGQDAPSSVRLEKCSSEAFKIFIKYVYTGVLHVDCDILADLMAMADYLDIPAIKQRCAKYLEEMPMETAIQSLVGKKVSSSNKILQFALSRISEEFTCVSLCRYFYDLDLETVCVILSRDDLHITSEMDVFRAGMKWITFNRNERQGYFNRIMRCVRFPHMREIDLLECYMDVYTDFLKDSQEFRNIIFHANWIVSMKRMGLKDPLECPVSRPRTWLTSETFKRRRSVFISAHSLPGIAVQVNENSSPNKEPSHSYSHADSGHTIRTEDILATGGFQKFTEAPDNRTVKMAERYYAAKNKWMHDINLPEPRFYHSMAMLYGKVYLVGGSDPKKGRKTSVATNDAFRYNAVNGRWTPIKPMRTARMHHEVVALDGMLYAVGGEDENGRVLNTVECYNPSMNQWIFVKPMSVARRGAGITVMDDKIYVAGGLGESSKRNSDIPVLSSMEVYDPISNSWTPENDLRFARCHANLVNVQGVLYLCGGATKSLTTNMLTSVPTIDVYNTEEGVWEQKSNLVFPRHFAGSAVVGGKIYIMGGVSTVANRTLSSVECYDAENDVWISGVEDLPYSARWLSCLPIPANMSR